MTMTVRAFLSVFLLLSACASAGDDYGDFAFPDEPLPPELVLDAVAPPPSCDDGDWRLTYAAAITDVYDGDTVTADIDLGLGVFLGGQKLRLYGVDAPEIRGAEKVAGAASRDWLRSRILGKFVTIKSIGDQREKYGRWLAIICDADGDIIADMIASGMADRMDFK